MGHGLCCSVVSFELINDHITSVYRAWHGMAAIVRGIFYNVVDSSVGLQVKRVCKLLIVSISI